MWNSYKKLDRVKEALLYRDIDPENMTIKQLIGAMERCVKTDRKLDVFVHALLQLEPAHCEMTHCTHYGGAQSFCECAISRVPYRCGLLRAFKKKKKKREEKKGTND